MQIAFKLVEAKIYSLGQELKSKTLSSDKKLTFSFENTVGKEEIAHNEQFPLFPQCF